METMNRNETDLCKINGVEYLDPTGDLKRTMLMIHILTCIVEDMFRGWSQSSNIDDSTIRHCAMETLRDSIDRMTYCIQKLDNLLDLTTKEVYHAGVGDDTEESEDECIG